MANPQEIEELMKDYCLTQRHPDLPPFVFGQHQTRTNWEGTDLSYKAGCYVIFNRAEEAIYIGKASFKATMGTRLKAHNRKKDDKWNEAVFVRMIEVTQPFEAPSLEEFLLNRITTKYNKVGAIKSDLSQL